MTKTKRTRSLFGMVDPTQLKVATLLRTHVSLRFILVLSFAACIDLAHKHHEAVKRAHATGGRR